LIEKDSQIEEMRKDHTQHHEGCLRCSIALMEVSDFSVDSCFFDSNDSEEDESVRVTRSAKKEGSLIAMKERRVNDINSSSRKVLQTQNAGTRSAEVSSDLDTANIMNEARKRKANSKY
jgi:hypothetical protein